MSLTVRAAWVIAGVLAAVGAASAGPIEWSYHIRAGGVNDSPFVQAGWVKTTANGEYFALMPNIPSEQSGTWTGSALYDKRSASDPPFVVATLTAPEMFLPLGSSWWPKWDPYVAVAFDITDAASGQTGRADFRFSAQATQRALDPAHAGTGPLVFWQLDEQYMTQRLTLGGHAYEVRVGPEQRGDTGILWAQVRVGDAASTPEPGTLVLAGLGLSACGGMWLRRRTGRGSPLAA